MNATATAKTSRIEMRRGAAEVIITLDAFASETPEFDLGPDGKPVGVRMIPCTAWMVEVVAIEWNGGNGQVGAVKKHSFGDLDEARAYANRWHASLKAKGYRRVA